MIATNYGCIGRDGTSEEVADASIMLCSDLSGYMSGVDLQLDGGYMALISIGSKGPRMMDIPLFSGPIIYPK